MAHEPEYLPKMPRHLGHRIGCVGAGFIMRDCHLVAYRQAGFNPVAIATRDPAKARVVADMHAIERVHDSVDALLRDDSIEVLDIAVPPDVQPALIHEAVRLGEGRLRGILAQKPLAMSVNLARDCVMASAEAGVKLAVNQNMRFDQSVRAMKHFLERGAIGGPILATIDMRAVPHWMPWSEPLHSLTTFIMSIHHLDTFRYWFGSPDRVFASTMPDPRTKFPHRDGINLYILEYDEPALRASAWDDVWAGPDALVKGENAAENGAGIHYRIEGTEGIADGTIGWPSYPKRTPSTLSLRRADGDDYESSWSEVWFPDAFAGTMAQLLCAIEDDREPEISGRDHLETLALCEAVFASGQEHRVTTPGEFLSGEAKQQ